MGHEDNNEGVSSGLSSPPKRHSHDRLRTRRRALCGSTRGRDLLRKSLKSSFGLMVSGARLQLKNGNITQDAHVSRCSGGWIMLRRAPENPATFTQIPSRKG